VNLLPQNTLAPYFNLMPGFTAYQYQVTEGTAISPLNGPIVSCPDETVQLYNFDLDCNGSWYSRDIACL
jgi:hypothetical protein